ncbi:MAG: TonB-dependent receptor, partial [Bacteroidetes bacterium]|nr:TonB-dependent receptor [Bacteroidota bacterium]
GDFATAGYVAYNTTNVLDHNTIKIEGGEFNHARIVAMIDLLSHSAREKGQSAYIAGEGLYFDGPFHYGMHFNRGNLFGKFITPLNKTNKLTIEASTFHSGWCSSGELPDRAIAEGIVKDRFGVIDSAQGGLTSRTNALVRLQTQLSDRLTLENQVFYTHYFLNLVSNFTFNYTYPTEGDEFRQRESRNLYGYNGKLSQKDYFNHATLTSTAGWVLRADRIDPIFMAHTQDGALLDYIQLGTVHETALNGYLDETLQTGKWVFNAGARIDYLHFYYNNLSTDSAAAPYQGVNPRSGKAIVSPKLNIQYTASPLLQIYAKLGKGFHSNDARVVIANQGYDILPAAYGADLGINWKPAPRLFVNAAVWYLYLKQEFTYGSDLGSDAVEPGGRTRRYGVDLSARYQVNDWLFGYLNVNAAHPRSLDVPKSESYIALAPTLTSTAGLDFRFASGWNGGLSYRYLHDRPGNEDNTLRASGYFLTDLLINYTQKKYEIGLTIENLFNTKWKESQFEELSRFKNESQPVDELSYTPGIPFFAKLKFSVFF